MGRHVLTAIIYFVILKHTFVYYWSMKILILHLKKLKCRFYFSPFYQI